MGLYFQKSCGALQQLVCLRGSNAPGFNGHVPELNKSAKMRLSGEPKRYLGKSWEQISVPGAEAESSSDTSQ